MSINDYSVTTKKRTEMTPHLCMPIPFRRARLQCTREQSKVPLFVPSELHRRRSGSRVRKERPLRLVTIQNRPHTKQQGVSFGKVTWRHVRLPSRRPPQGSRERGQKRLESDQRLLGVDAWSVVTSSPFQLTTSTFRVLVFYKNRDREGCLFFIGAPIPY